MTCQSYECNQGRSPCPHRCTKLEQANSDGTNPHAETRDLVELALDVLLALALVGALIFTVLAAIGFWSNK